jgi:hypothetical protein
MAEKLAAYLAFEEVNTLPGGPRLERNEADRPRATEVFSPSDADCIGKMMAAAVLFQAAEDLKEFRHQSRPTGQRLYREVCDWVTSNDHEWPCSFLNVCGALQLTPDRVRADLLADDAPQKELAREEATSVVYSLYSLQR